MRNIIKIFNSDARHLLTNVVAMVVLLGLAVIPSLYAWFNILSNWDPYGQESTSKLSVAVASEDTGTTIEGVELNVGDTIIDNLKANKDIHWVFVDTAYEAQEGVTSGDYYAALVIDQNFSKDMVSFIGGDINHPVIHYYENEKINAIAPKITSKVKTTVQQQVDQVFVSTLASGAVSASDFLFRAADENGTTITDAAVTKLDSWDRDLATTETLLNAYISIIDSTSSLTAAADTINDEISEIEKDSRAISNSADSAVDSTESNVDTMSKMMNRSLSELQRNLRDADRLTASMISDINSTGKVTKARIEGLRTAVDSLSESFDRISANIDVTDPTLAQEVQTISDNFDQLQADLDALADDSELTVDDATSLLNRVSDDFTLCEASVQSLSDSYENIVEPKISSTIDSAQTTIREVGSLLNYSSDSIDEVESLLDRYPDLLSMGKEQLQDLTAEISDLRSQLADYRADIVSIDGNEQYAMLLDLLETDPDLVSQFIADPVYEDDQAIYPVENNGSAMAPFYVVLSIWVGALILIAIIHTEIRPIAGVRKILNHQAFFGRYLVFFLMGQIQTAITVGGCLFYVGIQCLHPFLFCLASSVTAFTFTLMMYALSFAFGNVGEAAAVVLMVIQVAGSGGTFPIEVLPVVYRYLFGYMPFAPAMNMMRECIAGTYGGDYWIYMSQLGIYVGVSLFIGLVLTVPFKKLTALIEESKERTRLMV